MTHTKPTETSTTLVTSGKSSRLTAIRNKSLNPVPTTALNDVPASGSHQTDKQLTLAQHIIDQRIAELVSGFPTNKQHSLFKIRYGVELSKIRLYPIKRIISLLKITDTQLTHPKSEMRKILELTYHGQKPS